MVAYSTTLRLTNKLQEGYDGRFLASHEFKRTSFFSSAEKILKQAIKDTKYTYGEYDALLGRVHNALGLVYKQGGSCLQIVFSNL